MKKKQRIWYEIFEDMGDYGTRTYSSFNTIEKAKKELDELRKYFGTNKTFHVDKWCFNDGVGTPAQHENQQDCENL